jgi:hypothetical protein
MRRAAYELRVASLLNTGRSYAFPCDSNGRVDIDALDNQARLAYLYARSIVGGELSDSVICLRMGEAWSTQS